MAIQFSIALRAWKASTNSSVQTASLFPGLLHALDEDVVRTMPKPVHRVTTSGVIREVAQTDPGELLSLIWVMISGVRQRAIASFRTPRAHYANPAFDGTRVW